MSYMGDSIGTVRNSSKCGSCGPAVQALSNCSQYGLEWTYDGYGTCGTCKFNCVGSACTTGTYAKCKKFQHTANIDDCCLGKQPFMYPYVTCNPAYTPLAPVCTNSVQKHCAKGNNIFNDNLCTTWSNSYKDVAFPLKKSYCAQYPNDPYCKIWYTTDEAQGRIDDLIVTNYCKLNPTDSICSCINSEIPCPNKFDLNCIKNNGYKTYEMINVQCPNVLNCTQFLGLSPGAKAIATNVDQSCSMNTNSGNSGSSNSAPSGSVVNNSALSNIFSSNTIYILLFILLIFISIIISVIIYNKVNTKQKNN